MYSPGMPHCPHLHICLINTWNCLPQQSCSKILSRYLRETRIKETAREEGTARTKGKTGSQCMRFYCINITGILYRDSQNEKKAHIRQHFLFKKAALYVHFLLVMITNTYHLSFHLDGQSKSSSRNFETFLFVLYVSVFVFQSPHLQNP